MSAVSSRRPVQRPARRRARAALRQRLRRRPPAPAARPDAGGGASLLRAGRAWTGAAGVTTGSGQAAPRRSGHARARTGRSASSRTVVVVGEVAERPRGVLDVGSRLSEATAGRLRSPDGLQETPLNLDAAARAPSSARRSSPSDPHQGSRSCRSSAGAARRLDVVLPEIAQVERPEELGDLTSPRVPHVVEGARGRTPRPRSLRALRAPASATGSVLIKSWKNRASAWRFAWSTMATPCSVLARSL